jgi:general secretion pathway protein D
MKMAGVAVQGIRRTSVLVVTDRPEKIREIDQMVKELDRPPIQIMIESKLVELAPTYTNNLGIDWDKTFSLLLDKTSPTESTTEKKFQIQSGGTATTSAVFNMENNWRLGHLSASQYAAMLDFLKEKTDSKLISNPRLLAMDNEESSISVGTTVPIPQIQRGLGGTGDMVTFTYKEVNIQLNVSPHVGDQGEITMYVNPVIEEITDWVEIGVSRAPITNKRAVNSIITVGTGERIDQKPEGS